MRMLGSFNTNLNSFTLTDNAEEREQAMPPTPNLIETEEDDR